MPQPRLYHSKADKQRAYRDRKAKLQQQEREKAFYFDQLVSVLRRSEYSGTVGFPLEYTASDVDLFRQFLELVQSGKVAKIMKL